MIEIPIDHIIQQAIQDFARKEADKLKIQVNQLTMAIKFKNDGTPYYATLIDGKWIEGTTRYFSINDIMEALEG